jgi:hypothetical protein
VDNAALESFFALLEKKILDRRRWTTHHGLRMAIAAWIETIHCRHPGCAMP